MPWLAIAAGTSAAETYSVHVNPTLHGLDVGIDPEAYEGMLVVKLTNRTDTKIRCDLRYDASPQTIYRKATFVDPGKTEQSVFRAKRTWFSVTVDVDCLPVEKK